jgi:hypothetical protein
VLGGQAADGAQREGHRGGRGQRRMGAQEEELQRVVCGLGRSGRRLDLDPQLPITAGVSSRSNRSSITALAGPVTR